MDWKPKVSIITPTYNRARYLPEALDSVLKQTYSDFELIVIDDGSTDETADLMAGYTKDPRIVYVQQENHGQSVARNRGIDLARGEFICFLDSDNAWTPHKLELSLRAFEQRLNVDVVYGDFIVIDADSREKGTNRMKRHSGRITPQLLHDNFVSMNTTMTRRRCFTELGGFDVRDRLAEDYGLWLRFSTQYRFYYLPEILGYYRVMEDQISSDKDARFKANEQLIHQFIDAYPDALSSRERREGLSHFYVRKSRYELSIGHRNAAIKAWRRALTQYPVWTGPWRLLVKLVWDVLNVRRQ